jgi:hypothetical protein
MVAAVAARLGPHAPAGLAGEGLECLGRDARPEPIERTLGPLYVSTNAAFAANLAFYTARGYSEFCGAAAAPGAVAVHMRKSISG